MKDILNADIAALAIELASNARYTQHYWPSSQPVKKLWQISMDDLTCGLATMGYDNKWGQYSMQGTALNAWYVFEAPSPAELKAIFEGRKNAEAMSKQGAL